MHRGKPHHLYAAHSYSAIINISTSSHQLQHIDNPKGYSSDAQRYDMRLRPPVKDEELEIDPNNGMKKYIATEGEGFDTSTSCIRMHLRKCIELGRSEFDFFDTFDNLFL